MANPSGPVVSNFTMTALLRVKEEPSRSPQQEEQQQQGKQPLMLVKAEPEELPTTPLQEQQQEEEPDEEPEEEVQLPREQQQEQTREEQQEPQFFKSIDELGALSTAIDTFKRRFDELQEHIDVIQNAINAKFSAVSSLSPPIDTHLDATVPFDVTETPEQPQQVQQLQLPQQMDATEAEAVEKSATRTGLKSELQYLCQTMGSRSLRKYIISHLFDIPRLREEVPAALKLSPKPAKLVLDCIGRFFLQGSKAYIKNSPMIPARQASVLVLEFFLLMLGDCCSGEEIMIERSVKEEAEMGAIAWRKRLISEGGLGKASEVDARGLLLFVACFGIPAAFKIEDLRDLIRLGNVKEISDTLRRSHVLAPRIPDVIEGMIKKGMHVEAVDVAYTVGMEDKFSPYTILTSFLRESKEALKRTRREAHNSPKALKEANEKQLAALKSVVKCLEDHKVDPLKVLPGWQIKEQIIKLEKDVADLNKRMDDKATSKRKVGEIEPQEKVKSQETKRSKFTVKESALVISPHINGLHEQRVASHAEGKKSYDPLMPNSADAGLSSHVNSYLASSLSYGVGSLPENILGPKIGGADSVLTAGVVGSMVAGRGYLSAGSYGEMGIDKLEQMIPNTGLPYGWHSPRDATYIDRSIRPSFAGQPTALGLSSLYGSSPSVEGYVGLPNFPSNSAANRSSASDLYGFADTVADREAYNKSSGKSAPLAPGVPARHSSYMY